MKRFWLILGVLAIAISPFCLRILVDDLTHNERWRESFFSDPRAYVPVYLGIALFLAYVVWCDWWNTRRFYELFKIKTIPERGFWPWFSKVFCLVFCIAAPIRFAYLAHEEIQHPETWEGLHDVRLYLPAAAVLVITIVVLLWRASHDEKHMRKQAARIMQRSMRDGRRSQESSARPDGCHPAVTVRKGNE